MKTHTNCTACGTASLPARPAVNDVTNARVLLEVETELTRRLAKHGPGAYASVHETYGVIAEEVAELLDAIRDNDGVEVRKELFDIAVAALFGIASVDTARRI